MAGLIRRLLRENGGIVREPVIGWLPVPRCRRLLRGEAFHEQVEVVLDGRVEREAIAGVTITADPRLRARYDGNAGQWHLADGVYKVAVGKAADALELAAEARVEDRRFGR